MSLAAAFGYAQAKISDAMFTSATSYHLIGGELLFDS
jgi:hypothetical protein